MEIKADARMEYVPGSKMSETVYYPIILLDGEVIWRAQSSRHKRSYEAIREAEDHMRACFAMMLDK